MKLLPFFSFVFVILVESSVFGQQVRDLPSFLEWKQLDFINLPRERYSSLGGFPYYIQQNAMPMGLFRYKNKLFIGVPRRNPGIPSTLNYIDLDTLNTTSPKLAPYPNYQRNELHPDLKPDPERIVNVYRPRVDRCDRLVFIDTGVVTSSKKSIVVQRPSIWFIDLNLDYVVRRYEFPESVNRGGSAMVNLAIDVGPIFCEDTHVYIPDLFAYRLIVYSYQKNKAWSFAHNYFYVSPLEGNYDVGGQRFMWEDGIFSVALGNYKADKTRDVYFHAMSSYNEFVVSSKVLQDEEASKREYHEDDFQLFCYRGHQAQSNSHYFDPKTNVMFFNMVNKNGVACWNSRDRCSPETVDLVVQNNRTMIYPSDLSIDTEGNVWFMTNRFPVILYSQLNFSDVNYRIFRAKAEDLIKNTRCQLY